MSILLKPFKHQADSILALITVHGALETLALAVPQWFIAMRASSLSGGRGCVSYYTWFQHSNLLRAGGCEQ